MGDGGGAKVEPFEAANSSVFEPAKSKTFSVVPKAMFLLAYADETHLKGFQVAVSQNVSTVVSVVYTRSIEWQADF